MEDQSYFHTFPAAQGTQAGRPFFIAMCPLRVIPKLFVFDEEEVPAELRAQRTLNRARVPEIAHYLLSRRDAYVMSALTASVDAAVKFLPFEPEKQSSLGYLQIPMEARILINDGQHRRAAIEEAIKENPGLGSDNVPVLFFVDEGLVRSQQMFADLNRYAVRPSDSLSTLYDRRDQSSELARYLAAECTTFKTLTEFEKSTISNRSTKLFTLSSIKRASRALLRKGPKEEVTPQERLIAKEYWEAVAEQIPDWVNARQRKVSTADLRQDFIHAHGVTLQALGMAGAELLATHPKNWRSKIKALRKVDWSRTNSPAWEGRAIVNGRISKSTSSVHLASNYIKQAMGLTLSPGDREIESRRSGRSSN
ncbi:DNA sulfur modification protein DndB [Rubrivivax gelatinosus]|uniref:DNA sulfur modification protein DndB n=1 Tax=Rubrivivax gelatinosus TaxID=28068 RepID=A0A4R2MAU9_RUBGE|nr:DNA sulfur modification protein DndB [Rubrivivax gelatinosus]MBK1687759.1 DNA sulfur modification protein DndB [Rubrivivax gelatinosus]TCP03381.1 DNA sulfur modification protein DndB [Rubrivivax gelatinosus]